MPARCRPARKRKNMNHTEIVTALESFFEEEDILEDPSVLSNGTDLIDAGIIDSLLLVMLVSYCEDRFDCVLEPHELTEDNFRSLDKIAAYIQGKIALS
jgi:acyl carrier protein